MRKRIIFLVMIGILVISLVGCGKTANETKNESIQASDEISEPEVENPCEASGHTWIDATCTESKICSVCGETEGEALGHTLTEANYQQAPTCEVCGETVGEPLKAFYDGSEYAELNKTYDFESSCNENKEKTSIHKVTFSNYNIFDSDETHEIKEGYEWRSVDVTLAAGDKNTLEYGYQFANYWDDYYISNTAATDNDDIITVNYNGTEYDCFMSREDISQTDWVKNEQYKNDYGWDDDTITIVKNWTIQVPQGYDGFICGVLDPYSYNETIDDYERFIGFRMY